MARDDNRWAVDEIAKSLKHDARIANVEVLNYRLRGDFETVHRLRREQVVIARFSRAPPRTDGEAALFSQLDDDEDRGELERYVLPTQEEAEEAGPSDDPPGLATVLAG